MLTVGKVPAAARPAGETFISFSVLLMEFATQSEAPRQASEMGPDASMGSGAPTGTSRRGGALDGAAVEAGGVDRRGALVALAAEPRRAALARAAGAAAGAAVAGVAPERGALAVAGDLVGGADHLGLAGEEGGGEEEDGGGAGGHSRFSGEDPTRRVTSRVREGRG